jgi:hypothetical protein
LAFIAAHCDLLPPFGTAKYVDAGAEDARVSEERGLALFLRARVFVLWVDVVELVRSGLFDVEQGGGAHAARSLRLIDARDVRTQRERDLSDLGGGGLAGDRLAGRTALE